MTREEQIRSAASNLAISASRADKGTFAKEVFELGAKWADANPRMPNMVVKIPERSREEIKELLANWKGTLVVGDYIYLSPWISVDERLPEQGKEVIVSAKDKYVDIDQLADNGEGGYYWWKNERVIYCEEDKITHWMPIPEL